MKLVTNAVLAEKIDNLTQLVKDHCTNDAAFQEKLEHVLEGNGKPGLKTEVDRLVQIESTRKWNIRMLWTAIIGVGAKWIVDYFSN